MTGIVSRRRRRRKVIVVVVFLVTIVGACRIATVGPTVVTTKTVRQFAKFGPRGEFLLLFGGKKVPHRTGYGRTARLGPTMVSGFVSGGTFALDNQWGAFVNGPRTVSATRQGRRALWRHGAATGRIVLLLGRIKHVVVGNIDWTTRRWRLHLRHSIIIPALLPGRSVAPRSVIRSRFHRVGNIGMRPTRLFARGLFAASRSRADAFDSGFAGHIVVTIIACWWQWINRRQVVLARRPAGSIFGGCRTGVVRARGSGALVLGFSQR